MEEASSPGSTTSQLSYLGALQSPATSLTPLGFPAPYLLKDSAGLAAAAAAAGVGGGGGGGGGGGPKKKEGKPGSDVRSFGCQVTPCLRAWCLVVVSGLPSVGHPLMDPIIPYLLFLKKIFFFYIYRFISRLIHRFIIDVFERSSSIDG